ncbi:Lupus La protein [Dirofilaria immitis]
MLIIQKLLNFSATIICIIIVISAASNRSRRTECPDDRLMVYVNMTESDQEKYQINRTSASSLLECTRKCYNDSRCFSLKYRENDALGCLLTNFAPTSCLKIIYLPVAKIKYDIHTLITIECIKCELTKPKKLLTSSKTDDSDKPSLLSEQLLNDISISPLSTAQNTFAFVSNTSICDSSSMKCHENILFIAEEQTDLDSFDFLNETVRANSIQECAKKCFDNCCKMAIYSSIGKKCQFKKESTSSIDSDNCETKPFSSYVDHQYKYNRTKITCLVCGSLSRSDRYMLKTPAGNFLDPKKSIRSNGKRESEKTEMLSESTKASLSNNAEQSAITSTLDTLESSQNKKSVFQMSRLDSRFMKMACIVVFEVDPKANMIEFQAQDSVKVDRAEHCAYLCFRDACAAAIFTPATIPGIEGTCKRRFDIAEHCNATLKREYYYKTDKPIYLQCFRCLPEKRQTKPSLEGITPQSEISLKLLSEAESVTGIETNAALMETTLISAAQLTAVEMDSKEIEKNIGNTTFDTNKEDIGTSANVEEGEDKVVKAEDINLVETTKIVGTYLGMESRSIEQIQVPTESTEIFTPSVQMEASETAVLLSATDMEMATNGTTTSSSISDKAFENDSSIAETKSREYIFGSMSSNIPATIVSTQSIQEYGSTATRIQAFESAYRSTTESQKSISADIEKLDFWHQLTTEAGSSRHDALPYEIQPKMGSDGAEFTKTDNTVNEIEETITVPVTVPTAAGKSEGNQGSISDGDMIEAKSSERMEIAEIPDEIKQETPDVHIEETYPDGDTKTTPAYFKKENEITSSNLSVMLSIASDKSTLISSKEKKNASLLNDAREAFQTYLQGCIVTFQADLHSKRPRESSAGFQSSTTAQTAEVCAGRCYKDGCTGAKYNPLSKECVLGYSGKHFCNNGPEHFFYKANETIWIHCTGCKLHKPGDEGIDIMIQSSKAKTTNIKETIASSTAISPSTEAVETKEQNVKSTELKETSEMKSGEASVKSSFSTSEIEKSMEHVTEGTITEIPTSLSSSSLVAINETSAKTAKVLTAEEEGLELTVGSMVEKEEKIEDLGANIIPTISTSPIAGKTEKSASKEEIAAFESDCTVLFQARPIKAHSKDFNFEFIAIKAIPTVEQCAKRCYMDGCIGAKYDPVNQKCLLAFGDHHQCDENEQVRHSLNATETLWIHCISCKKEFIESTLGLFIRDTTTLPEVIEKSKEVQNIGLEFSAKHKGSIVAEGEFDNGSITIIMEEQETSRPSTLQSSMDTSTKKSDLNVKMEFVSTSAGVIEKFAGTNLQTSLTVSTDAKISESSTASPAIKEPTITSRTEFSERKDQEEAVIEFQEKTEPITISAEITITPMSHSETVQKFNEITDDIVEVVASVITNISSSVPETVTDMLDIKQKSSMSERSTTETNEIMSSVARETTTIESHVREISTTVKETPEIDITSSVTEETVSAKLDTEVIQLKYASTEKLEEASTSTSNQGNIEVISGILHETSEEGNNPDEVLFSQSQSISNSITQQPLVQETVNGIIEKVDQSTSIKDLSINTKPAAIDETIRKEAIKVVTEMTEGSLNAADKLIKGGEYMTTEPPVQAVSDLINVLSQNSKIEEVLHKEEENDAFVVDGISVAEDADEQTTTDILINNLQDDPTKNFLLNTTKIGLFKGIVAGCPGRIEFEILEAEDLSQLNVTSEILVESPAACAMKCYEAANCVLAAYKPSENDESTAICLLTNNSGVCSPQEKFIPQHKSDVSPLIISCLKCTKCNYTISAITELTRIHRSEIVEPALSTGQCAKICWKHNCTVSQYDHRSNLCSLSLVKGQKDCPQETPIVVNGDEVVLLECVRCFA